MLYNNYVNSYLYSEEDSAVTRFCFNRYWLEKAAYFISKGYENDSLPEYRSSVYDYPPDLLLPDIAFSVHYADPVSYTHLDVYKRQRLVIACDCNPCYAVTAK